jgi:FkbM family methyltransferase
VSRRAEHPDYHQCVPEGPADLARSLARTVSDFADRASQRQAGAQATTSDVRACFRLLLGREIDAESLISFRERLGRGVLARDLAREIMSSEEFLRIHQDILQPRVALTTLVAGQGFDIFVDPRDWAVGSPVARTGTYEPEVTATIRSLLEPGSSFIDVGANIGWYSLLAASLVGPTGQVMAVEANPQNCLLLERSAKHNGYNQIVVMPVAASDSSAVVALRTDATNGAIVKLDGISQSMPCSYVTPARPLDDIISETKLSRLDLMKIDVEGAEPQVLRGAAKSIGRFRPRIVSEFFPLGLGQPPEYEGAVTHLRHLRDLGYDLTVVGKEGQFDDNEILELVTSDPSIDHLDLLAVPT